MYLGIDDNVRMIPLLLQLHDDDLMTIIMKMMMILKVITIKMIIIQIATECTFIFKQ